MAEKQLSEAQKLRIERNRLKAQSLRQAKLVSHPYATKNTNGTSIIKVQGTKYVDSGGGFLLEQTTGESSNSTENNIAKHVEVGALNLPIEYEECMQCGQVFVESFLLQNFDYSVCDNCRDPEEAHSLITRTEAKAEYLLKDCDFDKREPPLKYISRKNPHNVRWGEMKLYLRLQIEKRAMDIWGSEEHLMKQHEEREEKREVSKIKKYNKQMTQLRREVRSSLFTKETKGVHSHEFGPDTPVDAEDTYLHTCLTCGFKETYEKI